MEELLKNISDDAAIEKLFDERELSVICELAKQMDLSKKQVLRQALRQYQLVSKQAAVLTMFPEITKKNPSL